MGCKYEGTGVWAGRCRGTREVDPCPEYDECKQYKPDNPTNADRIREMSDEELAGWIARTQIENVAEALSIVGIPWHQTGDIYDGTKKECLEWLKQPAEGE